MRNTVRARAIASVLNPTYQLLRMEPNDWMVLLGIIAIFSGFFSVLVGLALMYFRDFRIARLEKAVDSIYHTQASALGVAKRNEKAERQSMAMAEAAALLQSGSDPKEILKTLVAKYPDVAADMAKKVI